MLQPLKKILILILSLVATFLNSQAQKLSKEDAQIVKDIQTTIMQMSYKMDKDFDNYIVGEEMVRNSTNIQYKCTRLDLMHAKRNLILKNVDKSGDLLECEYANKKAILLAYTAVLGMPKYGGNKWTVKTKLNVEKNATAKYLFFDDSPIGFCLKNNIDNFLYFYFFYIPKTNNDIASTTIKNDNPNIFMSDYDRQQDSLDNTIAKPYNIKIGNL